MIMFFLLYSQDNNNICRNNPQQVNSKFVPLSFIHNLPTISQDFKLTSYPALYYVILKAQSF